MTDRITQQQLESYLWGSATLLRGTIDAGDYKQFIFPLLFYKRLCDVYDEETGAALAESNNDEEFAAYPENHRFQIPPEAHWRGTRKVAKNVGAALQSSLRAIETANPDKLYGIFGDAHWTNKDRLSDAMLRDLVEHFSSLSLTLANLPEDELGNGYEYLIKRFADDAGHTAAEFYTNRTVVHLMTEMLEPQPGESIYDPTCGSGGMLISCIAHLRRLGMEWRNARIYGQERNLMTSSIARMNCFLHGIEDFHIERGDTLADPKFIQGDHLQRFDIVLANPPYSIKQWDREAFASDPWGRNLFGVPPQGRADYAFWQHIIQSMNPTSGRSAILFPHGVLFRQEEAEMRQKIIESDVIECVLGLGPNLFYNSPMQSCIVVCRASKPKEHRNKILFIDAVSEVTREHSQSFLTDAHIGHVVSAYHGFRDEPGFARVVGIDEIRRNNHILNIPLYVERKQIGLKGAPSDAPSIFRTWRNSMFISREIVSELADLEMNKRSETNNLDEALVIPEWAEPSKWPRVTLGDVAEIINERVDDPASSQLKRFVGLEHFDPGCLVVRRWGSTENLISAMKEFAVGDTLFARRNAYLKRVSIVNFDGICSGDAIVLREKKGLVRGFLPFLLNTDVFWRFAIANAAGTMSRRVRAKTLLQYEFALPPLDVQNRIAGVLWSVDECKTRTLAAVDDARTVIDSELDNFLYHQTKWSVAKCGDLLAEGPRNGFSPPANEDNGGLPTLSISSIREGAVVLEGNLKYANVEPAEVAKFRLSIGDLLVVRGNGNRLLCGKVGIVKDVPDGCFYPDLLIRLRFRSDAILPEFAVMLWNEPRTHARLLRKAKSTSGIWKVNGKDIREHQLIVPPISAQTHFLKDLESRIKAHEALIRSAADSERFEHSLINAFLGGR
jgi:type I restriction enzyme M protein